MVLHLQKLVDVVILGKKALEKIQMGKNFFGNLQMNYSRLEELNTVHIE